MTASTDTRFSEELRAASWALHESAEGSHFMRDLMAGEVGRDIYATYIGQLHYVYSVLEEAAAAMKDEPTATPFVRDELSRVPALEADLTFFLGDDWAAAVRPTEATLEYCERLREACFSWHGGFVAHHYTRYLGDLSGGQFIGKSVERAYGLEDHEGARFYLFDQIADPTEFKNEYRRQLDLAQWNEEEKQRIIDEVRLAYRLNTLLLAALQ